MLRYRRSTRSHTLLFTLIILVTWPLLLIGCNKDKGDDPPDLAEIEKINNAVLMQELAYDQLTDLLQTEDTLTAKNTVLAGILNDPEVQSAGVNSQGLYIQYENGMRGGLIIDFEDDPQDTIPPFEIDTGGERKSDILQDVVPSNERTVILNPHYFEREYFTQDILKTYDNRLTMAGFNEPELHRNEDCTVEKFTFLENYGIIHIYSHGWPWIYNNDIVAVYLMTGEVVNDRTTNLYWKYILNGDIAFVTTEEKTSKYFLSPVFISDFNNFTKDTTLVYGGFCYSALGYWPEYMTNAGAIGYFGFDWSVLTIWNAYWARVLIYDLTNTKRLVPMTVGYWYDNTPTRPKNYEDETSPLDYVHLAYAGNLELALLKKKIQINLTKVNEVQCDVMSTNQWTCNTPNLTFQKISSTVNINAWTFMREWQYTTTFTGSIPVDSKGKLFLRFNDAFTEIDSFYVHNSWNYQADDEDLQKYGYPNIKTQTCIGHDLPIWVNEPDFDRYIYGIQGSDAADYLSTLECKYEFPDGSSCAIDKYEFTDETLQMIRFDFHIR